MSEYQYYEFQAIDRPLTEKERNTISGWSSRTEATATQAVFTYSYGDFPRDPEKVVEKYFDAMLYMANWGSNRLMFRFPRAVVDTDTLKSYCRSDYVSVSISEQYVVLDLNFHDEEGGDWIEGEGWLSSLIPLRQDILNGDYRLLYLAWLKAITVDYDIGDHMDDLEPPVPPDLNKLSGTLQSFVEFVELDENLLQTASEASGKTDKSVELDIETAVTKLSEDERQDFLTRLVRGESHLNLTLAKRLQELMSSTSAPALETSKRTIAELLQAAEDRAERRKARARRQAEKERIRKLETMAGQESKLWDQVTNLIEEKHDKAYKEAVKILKDLRDVAEYQSCLDQFQTRIDQLSTTYSRRSALKSRIKSAGLTQIIIPK